jgi:nitroimidazol reductase NimA-like FMN-containing flavoprotein (pyridoxamine 5'-phosphate oxidase superfamily)
MNPGTPQERAVALIEGTQHMTVATVGNDGQPWVSPVYFAHDDNYSLYWVSDPEALHSANIRERPEVAIVIHGTCFGKVDAVYIKATAVELSDEGDVRDGMKVLARRPQIPKWTIDDIAVVTGSGPWRIYKATRESTETRIEREKQKKPVVSREAADF